MSNQGWSEWSDADPDPTTMQFRQPPPPPGYAPMWAEPPRRSGPSPVMVVLVVVLVLVLLGALAVIGYLMMRGQFGSPTAGGPVTSTVVATAEQEPVQEAPQVQPAQPAPAAPAASAPAGSYQCSNAGGGALSRSAVGSSVTSCQFAQSVRQAYLADGNSGGSATIWAYSPVTGRGYTMSCSGGSVVTCTGGNNAVVYIY